MRLLLVEDDPVIARELALRWAARPWVCRHAPTLAAADDALRDDGFDLLLLDLGLPDGDGLAWLRGLRARRIATPVLVLTARDRVADRVAGLQQGADDYLVKPFAAEELEARMEVLVRRSAGARGRVRRFGALGLDLDEGRAFVDGAALELAPREFEVLDELVRRAPRLVPKRALVDALATANPEINESAAELYVSRLRRRLEGSGVEIRTVRGVGYQLAQAPGPAPLDGRPA